MSLLDIFKINDFKNEILYLGNQNKLLIESLADKDNQIQKITDEISYMKSEVESIRKENCDYKSVITDDHNKAINIKGLLQGLNKKKKELLFSISQNEITITNQEEKIINQKNDLIQLKDEILYQSFGLYEPLYDFVSSEDYKVELEKIRDNQKLLIKEKEGASCPHAWQVNDSTAKGRKMINDNIKQSLRSFNIECENAISKVKFNNFDSMKNRIKKSFEVLNKLNKVIGVKIEDEYLELKFKELHLAYEYAQRKQEEKEELRIQRDLAREEQKVLKELEEKRIEIEKEQHHYENVLRKINEQLLLEKNEDKLSFLQTRKLEITSYLNELDEALKDVDYREANQRAGYVYIISNIGSFGENVFKIGMTRRLDPQDRVDELGNASVPFRFDVHAMIFSDDAPKLENALHHAFEQSKINMFNNRKEFFKVPIEKIEEVIKENHDRTVEFTRIPPAQQFRETQKFIGKIIA